MHYASIAFACLVFSTRVFGTQIDLILNWKPEAEFGGFYAAELGGHFAKENLKVRILPGGSGTPVTQVVASGQAAFGISSADGVITSQDRGSDVVALFAVYQTYPQGLMVREERGIQNIEEVFQSGILAMQNGLPYTLFLAKKFGPIKAKIVPYLGGVAQLASDVNVAQQCFVTSEPILARQKGLKVKTFLVADTGFNPYTAVVVARRSYIEKNMATVAAFHRAITQGWKAYLRDPKPANESMSRLNPSMDMPTLEESARIQAPFIETAQTKLAGLGSMTSERWDALAKQLKELGQISAVKPAASYMGKF